MNSTRSFVQYGACVSAALACAAVMAMQLSDHEVAHASSETPRAAYLDCAHLFSSVREPDLVTICTMLAGGQPQRDADDPLASQPRPPALLLARPKPQTYAAPPT